jgi:hypothetical protein
MVGSNFWKLGRNVCHEQGKVPIADISLNSLGRRPIARASTENLVRARIR